MVSLSIFYACTMTEPHFHLALGLITLVSIVSVAGTNRGLGPRFENAGPSPVSLSCSPMCCSAFHKQKLSHHSFCKVNASLANHAFISTTPSKNPSYPPIFLTVLLTVLKSEIFSRVPAGISFINQSISFFNAEYT